MVCIYCGSSTQVINSRSQKRINQIWRRRRCLACHGVFTTHELADLGSSVMFQNGSQPLHPFNRDALLISIYECCKHRPNAAEEAAELTRTSLAFLQPQIAEGILRRDQVIAAVLSVLKRFDNVAATMYQAYHGSKSMS